MTQPAVAPNIHQALDVHVDFPAETPLDLVAGFDNGAELVQLLFVECVHSGLGDRLRLARVSSRQTSPRSQKWLLGQLRFSCPVADLHLQYAPNR